MATHHIENEANANQYYFDTNSNSASQANRLIQDSTYNVPVAVTSLVSPSEYSPYPAGVAGARAQPQQIRSDRNAYAENDSYQLPQQHQSVAGFSKSLPQQPYQSSPSPVPHVKATVRTVNSLEQQQQPQQQQHVSSAQFQQPQQSQQRQQQVYASYEQQGSPQVSRISPQQQPYQYDSRTQIGQPTGVSGHYQIPTSAQYSHHEPNQRTESPPQGYDNHVQVFVDDTFHESFSYSVKYIDTFGTDIGNQKFLFIYSDR